MVTTLTKPTHQFGDNAQVILHKRYLQPNETIEQLIDRISFGNPDYRHMIAELDFLPNSPTIFNAGTGTGTLSACFVFYVDDSMDGIMDVARKAALVQKWGGGVGYGLSDLRAKGSLIQSTHKAACGPVSVLGMYHAVGRMVTQAGRRDAAQMAILHVDHDDVMEFIRVKDENPQSLNTFNISVAITNKFMLRVLDGEPRAVKMFRAICESAHRTGDPGVFFIDTVNQRNSTPWMGELKACNPCGEVPLYDNEACNLGSINLSHMVVDGRVDWDKLKRTTRLATAYLDMVIDHNWFPVEEITQAVAHTRKIGLGVMGWADMLALLGIDYDTSEAVSLGETLISTIRHEAEHESLSRANTYGKAPCFEGQWPHLRNATLTCIAPTGTISILAGCSSGIEPHFDTEWTRIMGDGTKLTEHIPVMERLNGFVPKTARFISPEWHIRHQAAFQRHTDLAVSKTINMPNIATVEDIENAYTYMWTMGTKGGTIYRDGSRDFQVLNSHNNSPEKIPDGYLIHGGDGSATGAGNPVSVHVGSTPTASTNNLYSTGSPGSVVRDTGMAVDSVGGGVVSASSPCPSCGQALLMGDGCMTCPNCGEGSCRL